MEHTAKQEGLQVSTELSTVCEGCLEQFLAPLLLYLDQFLDKRLVRTLAQLVRVIIVFRHNRQGLLLSELGGYLLSPAHAPAGTKRISNLLHSPRWSYHVLERFLWRRAEQQLQQWEKTGQDVLAVWDESVLEKPESETLEGLCAVRSSDRRTEELHLLDQCAQAWGPRVLQVGDRGFAGSPWLTALVDRRLRFVLRWPKRYTLLDEDGQRRPAWQIARGRRTWGQRQRQDTPRRQWRTTGVLAISVSHPDHPQQPLWLIVARPGHGREPWYLLTTAPVALTDDAWQLVLAYVRRWRIEMAWRYNKSELAIESLRLWAWETRLKLLLSVALAYAFLLSLLVPWLHQLRQTLLATWCHRTRKRSQEGLTPLYRLRTALSRLWLAHPPPLTLLPSRGNSG